VFEVLTACLRGRVGVLVTGDRGAGKAALVSLLGDAVPDAGRSRVAGDLDGVPAPAVLDPLRGRPGWLGTVTANNPRDAVHRLAAAAMAAAPGLAPQAGRELAADALEVIVHLTRLADGSPRIARVVEVVGVVDHLVAMQTLFELDRRTGRPVPSGLRPLFLDRLQYQGIDVGPGAFALRRSSPDGASQG
jgi:pilus assembly protein CpaF